VNEELASPQHPRSDHAPGFRAIRWNIDWILRPLFGIVLAIVAVAAVFALAPKAFAALLAVLLVPAAREWHRMVGAGRLEPLKLHLVAGITVLASAGSLALLLMGPPLYAFLPLAAGFALAAILAKDANPLWQGAGAIYLGLPVLALVALRTFFPDLAHPDPASGARVVVGLFFIVWATDTGALIFGNLIGGPRLAPRLSPGKTWAGTIGGSLTAALVYGAFVAFLGGPMGIAAGFAFMFSIVGHAGDLLESFVKRRFGRKNSGSAIPGHGGVLDRIDSLLAASLAMTVLVFCFHLNPLFWGHQ
jgi:phosphatidate cytidylyltransferase